MKLKSKRSWLQASEPLTSIRKLVANVRQRMGMANKPILFQSGATGESRWEQDKSSGRFLSSRDG